MQQQSTAHRPPHKPPSHCAKCKEGRIAYLGHAPSLAFEFFISSLDYSGCRAVNRVCHHPLIIPLISFLFSSLSHTNLNYNRPPTSLQHRPFVCQSMSCAAILTVVVVMSVFVLSFGAGKSRWLFKRVLPP